MTPPSEVTCSRRKNWSTPAQCFLSAVILLLVIGILAVYSASFFRADARWGDPLFYVSRQVQGLVLGLAALWVALRLSPTFWLKLAPLAIAGCLGLLTLALFVADSRLGARRWLDVPGVGVTFQPSELVKISFPLFIAWSVVRFPRLHLTRGWLRRSGADPAEFGRWKSERGRRVLFRLVQLAVLGALVGLIAVEPDLGTSVFILTVGTLLLVASRLPWIYFVLFAALAIPAGYQVLQKRDMSEIRQRFDGVLNPERVPQVWHGLLSIGSGGTWGRGLGEARGKELFIPEEYNDFIFTIYAEETGFVGVLVLLLLYSVILQAGWRIARDCPNPALRILALGLTLNLVVQAIVNLMVTTAMAPTKGIGLPLVSYGSTSLTVALLQVGVILSIARLEAVESTVPERVKAPIVPSEALTEVSDANPQDWPVAVPVTVNGEAA